MTMHDLLEAAATLFEAAGVVVLVVGTAWAAARVVSSALRSETGAYGRLRRDIGRSILLGLELLVAADIIRTVAVTPTLENVLVLALIVAIRTFLSFSLELEITGRWPWQKEPETQ